MRFSPSILTHFLLQTSLGTELRRSLVAAFTFGGEAWTLLDVIQLPAELPATYDPFILALRRLLRKDFGELRAVHRVAAERAALRPFGFLHLVLEEAAQRLHPGEPPPPEHDEAFLAFFEIPFTKLEAGPFSKELSDLRTRAAAEVARRQIAAGAQTPFHGMSFSWLLTEEGTGDPELEAFLAETEALARESEGNYSKAALLRRHAEAKLVGYPVPDRAAEAMVDLADLLTRASLGLEVAEYFYERAEDLLAKFPADLNRPLRRRLENARLVN